MTELLGTGFLYRRWDASPAPASPKAVFLLVHGLGGHTARWDFLANDMARNGFASYGLELRGYGRTPERPRGHAESLGVYEKDILALREVIVREHPGKKIFILGESIGSLVAFNMVCRRPEAFDGQSLISPDFKNGLKFPLSAYLTLAALILFRPKKILHVPFTSEMCTRDPDYQAVMDSNPDEIRAGSLKILLSILLWQMKSPRLAKRLRTPTLFLISGKDLLVDERASRKIFAKLAFEDKTLIEYPEMLHALSIDLGREKVFRDIVDWTSKRA